MKRRSLPVAAALTATAALLLTACSSGDDKAGDNDKIAGADQGGEASSPSPRTAPSPERPRISLPGDVKNVFDGWTIGDPGKDAVLADVKQRINATDAAIAAGDPDAETLGLYYKGEALVGVAEWVQGYVDDGKSITGTVRFYKPDLVMVDKDTAAFAYCADETKAFDKDRKTGKADQNAVTDDAYVAYNTRVEKNQDGVWQTSSLLSERGNAKCTP
ncbi:hypothetical protein [Streptomyces poriticola]|uniref:hypothetical protein n=1 Tax=Streptomyces poriticola TaxID=3120506 RepID=UPI002FCE1B33